MNKKTRLILSNFLIIASLLTLLIIYLPVLKLYLPVNQQSFLPSTNSYVIKIPKINAAAPIISEVNPWVETEYKDALEQGVAQAKGSQYPGERGAIFLFAHSSQPPWKLTYLNTAFLRLGELKTNDEVIIDRDNKEYRYIVTDKREVWPTEVNYLKDIESTYNNSEQQVLILQTCTPLGTSLKRLLVFAKFESQSMIAGRR